jgi:hypothetical protein
MKTALFPWELTKVFQGEGPTRNFTYKLKRKSCTAILTDRTAIFETEVLQIDGGTR